MTPEAYNYIWDALDSLAAQMSRQLNYDEGKYPEALKEAHKALETSFGIRFPDQSLEKGINT